MRFPDFLVIGPGRSATTYLYEVFKAHPEICMAKNTKETNYFCDHYHKGMDWYSAFFQHCLPQNAAGEICNMYIYDPEVPRRIHEALPDVKLIAILRNPFERIDSVFKFRKRSGEMENNLSIEEALKIYPDMITQNYYGDQIERYFEYFDENHFLITYFDDLKNNAEDFVRNIFTHINVDNNILPDMIHQKINPAVRVRHKYLAMLSRCGADTLRRLGLYFMLNKIKRSKSISRVLFIKEDEKESEQKLPDNVIIELSKYFHPQIQKVERITGRDLRHWYK